MPNHVQNIIRMKGIGKLPLFTADKDGVTCFDFNKLIPMPESLNIESGSIETDAIAMLIIKLTKGVRYMPADVSHLEERICDRFKTKEEKQKMLEKGLKYAENIVKYGASTWYDWCVNNWGTKWNAYENQIEEDEIRFLTAWSEPEPIIRKLAEMFPDSRIEHHWADEDRGSNTGFREWGNGEWNECLHDFCSNEAYEEYMLCWGDDKCFHKDEDGNWQVNDCDNCHGCD